MVIVERVAVGAEEAHLEEVEEEVAEYQEEEGGEAEEQKEGQRQLSKYIVIQVYLYREAKRTCWSLKTCVLGSPSMARKEYQSKDQPIRIILFQLRRQSIGSGM